MTSQLCFGPKTMVGMRNDFAGSNVDDGDDDDDDGDDDDEDNGSNVDV